VIVKYGVKLRQRFGSPAIQARKRHFSPPLKERKRIRKIEIDKWLLFHKATQQLISKHTIHPHRIPN
jgi:hypothetical protein